MPEGPTDQAPSAPASPADRPGPHGIDRRRFLALAGATGAVGIVAATLGRRGWDDLFGGRTSAGTAGTPSGRTLVLVTLYGGNDGLNTVVPYQDSAYAATRGLLAVDPSTVLPIGDGYGLHSGMTGFKRLWDAKRLAIVHGVGFADPNYSHFQSMDIWQSGVPGTPVSTGWLGRWLDATNASPLRAISIGPTLQPALSGARVQGAAIPVGAITLPGSPAEQGWYASLSHPVPAEPALTKASATSGAVLLELSQRIGPILADGAGHDPLLRSGTPPGTGTSPAGGLAGGGGGHSAGNVLATQLSVVANLILAGASTDVYAVELGGFDTHADQLDTQDALLTEVDSAVSAFVDAMAGHPRAQGTVVLVYTEFGRRLAANASAGTDHGWANVAFVAGPRVKGGFYGEPPSLTELSEGNTVYTTDFRALYAAMFAEVLGVDPTRFLGGSFTPVRVV